MPAAEQRRSPRRAIELPIRVFGTDFQGRDFVEDSETLVVSRHGAKICLAHKLIPEQEIQILCQGNNREALFRVVCQAGEPNRKLSSWGVECLKPGEDIWEGARPRPKPVPQVSSRPGLPLNPKPSVKATTARRPEAKGSFPTLDPKPTVDPTFPIQATLRCGQCGMRELVSLEERQVRNLHRSKGLIRDCPACGTTGLWKRAAG